GVAELAARFAALQRSARSRGAEPAELLDAALSELEGAVELLQAEAPAQGPVTGGARRAGGGGAAGDRPAAWTPRRASGKPPSSCHGPRRPPRVRSPAGPPGRTVSKA